jgi:cell wall-associated NlpC family hydrolase
MANVGRRSAVVAASGGLVMSMAMPASAAPSEGPANSLPPVDVAALTAGARAALATSPVVSVPEDAAWSFDVPAITVVANPKPTPPPARSSTTARSATRSGYVPQAVAGNAVLEIAARYVGVRYLAGGASPDGFDCSGFVSYGVRVSRADALPGDIIVSPGHVGIYAGENYQIDSPRPGKTIQFRSIWQSNPIFVRVTG